MRAAVLPEVGASLRVEELRDPRPKPGEVLVRVRACGVCHTDLHVIKGEVKFPTPCVLGHEISGVVEEVGAGVDGLRPGQAVACAFIMPCGTCFYCVRREEDLCERFFEGCSPGCSEEAEAQVARKSRAAPEGSPRRRQVKAQAQVGVVQAGAEQLLHAGHPVAEGVPVEV
jgi:Zn-dependent alcohol dehydrogenase